MNSRRFFGAAMSLLVASSVVIGVILVFQKKDAAAPVDPFPAELPMVPWDFAGGFQDGVGLFSIYGPLQIESEGGPFGVRAAGADMMVRRLQRFVKNKRVKALVVRINSPGGSVGASQELYEALREIRRSGVPVVASFGDLAASGGYYISCAADSIVANPGTVTGSIGVIVGSIDLSRLLKRWDIGFNIIKSKEHKDILAYWREMTPREREMLQKTVDRIYRQFVGAVSAGRGLSVRQVESLADGSILSGEEALAAGLVDRVGTLQDAIALAGQMAGLKDPPHVIQERPTPVDLFSMLVAGTFHRQGGMLEGPMAGPLPVSYLYDPSGGALSSAQFARLLAALASRELP
ncbi:signal peptide peptidase SppA [bacterium]|nr:signal peptide peptidase SppA [bacterium]